MGQNARIQTIQSYSWSPTRAYIVLLLHFAYFGINLGGLGVLWALIIRELAISKGVFGGLQAIPAFLGMLVLLAGGSITLRVAKKLVGITALICLAAGSLLLSVVSNLPELALVMMTLGVGDGLMDLSINAASIDWEKATKKHALNIMHAGFAAGAMLGSFATGWAIGLGWSYRSVLLLIGLLGILALLATVNIKYPPSGIEAESTGLSQILALLSKHRRLSFIALICSLGVMGESVANLWTVIYLQELGASTSTGGAALAAFNGAMLLGRLANAPFVMRFGERVSLVTSGILLLLANLLLFVPSIPTAMVGFALTGLGSAGVIPTALGLGHKVAPKIDSGAIAGISMSAVYACFILCPPVVGLIADSVSLRAAMILIGLSGLFVLLLVVAATSSPSDADVSNYGASPNAT